MPHDRKFRFGVQTRARRQAQEWREKARKVEALGYSTLYMPDHFLDSVHAPMVGIAMAAEATETLRVGTLVLGNDYKHPAVVAKEFAQPRRALRRSGRGRHRRRLDEDRLRRARLALRLVPACVSSVSGRRSRS